MSQPAALLDAWATSLRQRPAEAMRRFFVPSVKVDALATGLDGVCSSHGIDYAVTHEAAAQRYAPILSNVSQVRIRLPAGSTTEAALGELGARPVSEGANLVVIDAKSPVDLLFRAAGGRCHGWPSPIQTYLDLVRAEGRAKRCSTTCAGKGSASDGQTFALRRIQRCLHRGLRACPRHAVTRSRGPGRNRSTWSEV